MIFDCYIMDSQYDAVRPMIENFSAADFLMQLERPAIIIARRFKMHNDFYRDLTLFLVDFVFARIDMSFANLSEPFGLLPELRNTPLG